MLVHLVFRLDQLLPCCPLPLQLSDILRVDPPDGVFFLLLQGLLDIFSPVDQDIAKRFLHACTDSCNHRVHFGDHLIFTLVELLKEVFVLGNLVEELKVVFPFSIFALEFKHLKFLDDVFFKLDREDGVEGQMEVVGEPFWHVLDLLDLLEIHLHFFDQGFFEHSQNVTQEFVAHGFSVYKADFVKDFNCLEDFVFAVLKHVSADVFACFIFL